jgi:hypothetical protein
VVLSVLAWTVMDAGGIFGAVRDNAASRTGTTGAGTTASASASGQTSGTAERSSDQGAADPGGPSSSPTATPYPLQLLDEKNSLSIKDGVDRKDRKGDIRFTCAKEFSCALESKTSVIAPVYDKPGATLDTCRAYLAGKGADNRLPLAIITTGSEICFQHPDGYIGLFVVQTKSTALPKSGSSFLTGALTVWQAK